MLYSKAIAPITIPPMAAGIAVAAAKPDDVDECEVVSGAMLPAGTLPELLLARTAGAVTPTDLSVTSWQRHETYLMRQL